jgi:hypothetical protein
MTVASATNATAREKPATRPRTGWNKVRGSFVIVLVACQRAQLFAISKHKKGPPTAWRAMDKSVLL